MYLVGRKCRIRISCQRCMLMSSPGFLSSVASVHDPRSWVLRAHTAHDSQGTQALITAATWRKQSGDGLSRSPCSPLPLAGRRMWVFEALRYISRTFLVPLDVGPNLVNLDQIDPQPSQKPLPAIGNPRQPPTHLNSRLPLSVSRARTHGREVLPGGRKPSHRPSYAIARPIVGTRVTPAPISYVFWCPMKCALNRELCSGEAQCCWSRLAHR
jgi:hypothetical protein